MFDDTYQNTVELGSVAVFDNVECSKAQAMKVLEEAAEVFGAWQKREKVCGVDADDLIGELCDVIQECCNMAAAVGCDDLRLALWDCEDRNRKRGRITGMVDRGSQRTREKCKRFVFVPIEVRQKIGDSWEAIEHDSMMPPIEHCDQVIGQDMTNVHHAAAERMKCEHLMKRCKAIGGAE